MDFPIKRALLSVTDKTGLVDFARFLSDQGVELVSTGGTCKTMQEAGLFVVQVDEVTGFPEILGGRVKTLHPKVHGGILADKANKDHMSTLDKHGIAPFDLVCVNLYNFEKAREEKLPLAEAVEQIDIGGPCMLRAAAKNFHSVVVVPAVKWYNPLVEELRKSDMRISLKTRQALAKETFSLTSAYDAMISDYL